MGGSSASVRPQRGGVPSAASVRPVREESAVREDRTESLPRESELQGVELQERTSPEVALEYSSALPSPLRNALPESVSTEAEVLSGKAPLEYASTASESKLQSVAPKDPAPSEVCEDCDDPKLTTLPTGPAKEGWLTWPTGVMP